MSLGLRDSIVGAIGAGGEGLLSVVNRASYTIFTVELIIKSGGSRQFRALLIRRDSIRVTIAAINNISALERFGGRRSIAFRV
jgi:hypothetical protein